MYESGIILRGSCAMAVITLCVKVIVMHRRVYPLLSHRVMGKAQVRFSTGLILLCMVLEAPLERPLLASNPSECSDANVSVDKRPGCTSGVQALPYVRRSSGRWREKGAALNIRPLLVVP